MLEDQIDFQEVLFYKMYFIISDASSKIHINY